MSNSPPLTILACCLALFSALTGLSKAAGTEKAVLPYDVVRAVIPGKEITQFGVIYRSPDMVEVLPGIIVLHGWAPTGTVGAALVAELAFEFQQAGYISLALSMRGWPETGGKDDCGGQQPQDIAEAAHWFARQPGVDPNRIALVGHSQGGQVALLTGTLDAPLKAIVAYAPVTDLKRWREMTRFPGIADYVNKVCAQPPGLPARSPFQLAEQIRFPVLLVHGTKDNRVHFEQSRRLTEAMRQAGRHVRLLVIPEGGHHWSDLSGAEAALEFLKEIF